MSGEVPGSVRMQEFIARLGATGIAAPGQLLGCSPEEVQRLEDEYGVRLPDSYRQFLLHMGHGAGRLGNAGEFDLFYPAVLCLTREQRQYLDEVFAEDPGADLPHLPPQALVVCGRYDEQFSFIDCTRPDDSPVFHFNYWESEVRQGQDSFFGFLETLRTDAAHWMPRSRGEH